jgi:A/G-specific adenine glycosylase
LSRVPPKLFPEKRAFQGSLLRWYSSHQRDLPWRKSPDPYRVLISEFMLQQTRVETVIPFFHRFLKVFPNLESLAKASPQRVLLAWAGLGYYSRARNLHSAARVIFRDFGGEIPSSREELLKLPGLGPYTAGAVASLAFNEPVPALDGKVHRVLGRLFQAMTPPLPASSRAKRENFWESWIPSGRASDFNQALMDLGAAICTPSRPRCSECPVKKFCSSRGTTQTKKPQAKRVREEKWVIALVEKDGGFLIHRKEEKGLLGGLWQFPTLVLDRQDRGDEKKALERFLRQDFGLAVEIGTTLPQHEYFFTHIRALMKPFLCSSAQRNLAGRFPEFVRWVKPLAFSRYPVSTAMRQVASLLKRPAKYYLAGGERAR